MIKSVIDPIFEKFEFSEINDKPVLIQLCATESHPDTPIMPVNKCTVPVVTMLTVRPRNIRIDFFAGRIAHAVILQLSRTIIATVGALVS
ncbi:hypothetical protein Verru16b_03200 [Lacunisphaera limnophila]|uniref:Uncharacterized protein n=1 Tax=Lacunisphaera limnophila TaxID=1838286 RepID=A0A1D8AZ22_9BACT|nr:hypothetical protein Verru16b_03200 [Lacunisphaera limnophila]